MAYNIWRAIAARMPSSSLAIRVSRQLVQHAVQHPLKPRVAHRKVPVKQIVATPKAHVIGLWPSPACLNPFVCPAEQLHEVGIAQEAWYEAPQLVEHGAVHGEDRIGHLRAVRHDEPVRGVEERGLLLDGDDSTGSGGCRAISIPRQTVSLEHYISELVEHALREGFGVPKRPLQRHVTHVQSLVAVQRRLHIGRRGKLERVSPKRVHGPEDLAEPEREAPARFVAVHVPVWQPDEEGVEERVADVFAPEVEEIHCRTWDFSKR
ncbi:hypothetical protein THAOC_07775 [Thalassiosira oceanica]|uniref:Uncharacterized protein n=1 Tax=Thalassiosira oceanica TaxID=159749 RepID=K0SWQ4_THAOC|nr:hypothetical protein THAOC_07775 [Thalassiosira oceanica]|eukprot:EJK70838.1 hypothetical protein THAOC_07775 [Thalassiosira oceanica]